MDATSTLQIDLDAIAHNVAVLRGLCSPEVRFCAVLKGDGYGLGASAVAPTLAAAGVSMFAVFSPSEAEALLPQGVPLLILMPTRADSFSPPLAAALKQERLHLVIHDAGQMQSLEQLGARLGTTIPVHLKIDTGLHRGGCDPRDAIVLIRAIQRSTTLALAGLMTHFAEAASSEQVTASQMRQLCSILDSIRPELSGRLIVHAAGSCGLLRGGDYHADMVRVGLGWTGHLTSRGEHLRDHLPEPLRPAVTWRSQIALVRTIAAGERVGYGGRWTADRPTRLGVIPVGYGDGYPHDAGHPADGGPGLAIGLPEAGPGETVPVIGSVNMDQVVVDLTDAPGAMEAGSPVELISTNPGSPSLLENLSRRLQRPPHALLVQVQSQVIREYTRAVSDPASPAITVAQVAAG
ncbi:MAG: alanine racemase [Phycisphaerales bacterium]|nr:alanine racemase [Phycisphaerales bacterium]